VVVCARRESGGEPDRGARDQYMPDAGAGSTFGAVFGSGSAGKEMCGARVWREGVAWFAAGEDADCDCDCEGGVDFGAIADVERRFRGRWVVGVGFGDIIGRPGVDVGGERGVSGLGVLLPLLVDAALELLDEGEEASFCESDCDRARSANSGAFFRLS
jgi:hypothetical protein